nr:hypothetical protein [Tsukamurella sp. PLM1]
MTEPSPLWPRIVSAALLGTATRPVPSGGADPVLIEYLESLSPGTPPAERVLHVAALTAVAANVSGPTPVAGLEPVPCADDDARPLMSPYLAGVVLAALPYPHADRWCLHPVAAAGLRAPSGSSRPCCATRSPTPRPARPSPRSPGRAARGWPGSRPASARASPAPTVPPAPFPRRPTGTRSARRTAQPPCRTSVRSPRAAPPRRCASAVSTTARRRSARPRCTRCAAPSGRRTRAGCGPAPPPWCAGAAPCSATSSTSRPWASRMPRRCATASPGRRRRISPSAYWVEQLSAALPLAAWEEILDAPPERLVGASGEFGTEFRTGWRVRAAREREPRWAAALARSGEPADLALVPGPWSDALSENVIRAFSTMLRSDDWHPLPAGDTALIDAAARNLPVGRRSPWPHRVGVLMAQSPGPRAQYFAPLTEILRLRTAIAEELPQ